jgi:nucleotide-binding universal stress UspA family protein
MRDFPSAPAIVVGTDKSPAATHAAAWAAEEAASRDIPLRLVHVIDPAELCGADARTHYAAARATLYVAQRAIEATGWPVKVETHIVLGRPAAKLIEESASAAMVCVGSIGIKHACRGMGSVAVALARSASCPVAVIRARRAATPEAGSIVVEGDNGVVLHHAFEEAKLRGASLQVVASWRAGTPDDVGDKSRLVRAHLNRKTASWMRLYPGVQVEPVAIRDSVCRYLAANADSVRLFVAGVRGGYCDLGSLPAPVDVLTVCRNHL